MFEIGQIIATLIRGWLWVAFLIVLTVAIIDKIRTARRRSQPERDARAQALLKAQWDRTFEQRAGGLAKRRDR